MKRLNNQDDVSLVLMLLLVAMFLVACSPVGGDEPAAEPAISSPEEGEEDSSRAGSGLATLAPTADAVEPVSTAGTGSLDSATSIEQIEEDAVEEQDRATGDLDDAVTPAVVDLSKLTPEPADANQEPQEMPQPGIPNPSVAASNRAAVDLADQLGLDLDDVEVISVQQVEWPDSSLGCPQPGQNYLMVITPGFRIILEANGEKVTYHADTQGRIMRCDGGGGVQDGPMER